MPPRSWSTSSMITKSFFIYSASSSERKLASSPEESYFDYDISYANFVRFIFVFFALSATNYFSL